MPNPLIRTAIRTLFVFTRREQALHKAETVKAEYLAIEKGLPPGGGQVPVEVPPMRGVDEDMRRWSFYMLIEHNTIVNRSITLVTKMLAEGRDLSEAALIDPKTGVMPSQNPGPEQMEPFVQSVDRYVKVVGGLKKLRGSSTTLHPVFGPFDAHKWACMFPFHLGIHLPQARFIAEHCGQGR
jgi:hypothetical protein